MLTTVVCVLAAVLAVSGSPADPFTVVGPLRRGLRISGGSEAEVGDYPFQVALFKTDNFIGSGVLISLSTVLTAAQCIDGIQGIIQVKAGFVKLDDTKTPEVRDVALSARLLHPNFDIAFFDNDVALITLPYALKDSNSVSPISLPSYSTIGDGFSGKVEVSGWGKTSDSSSGTTTNVLQSAFLNLVDSSKCAAEYPDKIIGTKLCASDDSGVGTCKGDAGGPVTQTAGKGANLRVNLIGLISFNHGCGDNKPVVFTRVSAFYDFIEQNSDVQIANV